MMNFEKRIEELRSIDIFHGVGGFFLGFSIVGKTWDFFVNLVVVQLKSELDHSVDTISERSGFIERETGCEQ